MKKKEGRCFGGPINAKEEPLNSGFLDLELNEYRNMQNKHLQAYMRGDQYFFYKGKRYEVEYKNA
jgi:hypothetical protein